jgi:ParB-like nuclease family protein
MILEPHPLCGLFPVMDPEELQALADDMKSNGQLEPIVLLDGKILDGRNRYLACKKAGREPIAVNYDMASGSPEEFVWSKNAERRHLTPDQKRDLAAKLLKADPGKSNRQIAAKAKVDHKTAGAVRTELEACGEIPHVPKTTDTKGRQQPARKPAKPKPKPPKYRSDVLTLSSSVDQLFGKWWNEGGKDGKDIWIPIPAGGDYEFTARRRVAPAIDPKAETGPGGAGKGDPRYFLPENMTELPTRKEWRDEARNLKK